MSSNTARWIGVGGAAVLLAIVAGCAGTGQGTRSGGRPFVQVTAAEAASRAEAEAAAELDFFDELDTRRLIAQDDVIHAALLLGQGRSAPTYEDRVGAASRLGYIEPGFDRPAREAATIGDVAQVMVRVLAGGRPGQPASQEQAVAQLVDMGLLPAPAKVYQGLTGPQLLTVLGGVQDTLRARGMAKLSWPEGPGSVPALATTEPVVPMAVSVTPAVEPPAPAPAPPAPAPSAPEPEPAVELADRPPARGRPEPLPQIDLAGAAQAPRPAPPVAPAPPAPSPAPAPVAAPPAPAKPASKWYRGKPLPQQTGGQNSGGN